MVAALHDREPVDPSERAALLWLEQQPPPHLDVDLSVAESDRGPNSRVLGRRQVRSVFVPVNDVTLVGDPEAPLRAARQRLIEFQDPAAVKRGRSDLIRARREVEREEAKFIRFIAEQHEIDARPAEAAIRTAAALLPDRRIRQERTFPVVVPGQPYVRFFWPGATPGDHLQPLRQLCYRVTRLGHSSSLVACNLIDEPVLASLVPGVVGEYVLRVVGPGQLERLETAYTRHQAVEARVLPARPQRYSQPRVARPEPPQGAFASDWIVLERIGGDRPLSSRGPDLAMAMRRALIEVHGREDLPPVLSGHWGSTATGQDHMAFVPLPWVGHEHADGSLQGLALISPRSINSHEREALLRLVAKWEVTRGDEFDDYALELGTSADNGRRLVVRLRRVEVPAKSALNAWRWCRPSRRYVTATPIALDRHPGNLRSNVDRTAHKAADEAERTIADACERIGLPRPVAVSISLAPLLPGAQHVRLFAPWPPQPGRTRRARIHAEIRFAGFVKGPVLIGAGRHFGLGLCLPVEDGWDRRGETA
jgi:CRISPR-associated protein Csb2